MRFAIRLFGAEIIDITIGSPDHAPEVVVASAEPPFGFGGSDE